MYHSPTITVWWRQQNLPSPPPSEDWQNLDTPPPLTRGFIKSGYPLLDISYMYIMFLNTPPNLCYMFYGITLAIKYFENSAIPWYFSGLAFIPLQSNHWVTCSASHSSDVSVPLGYLACQIVCYQHNYSTHMIQVLKTSLSLTENGWINAPCRGQLMGLILY